MCSPKVNALGDIDIETCRECGGTVNVMPKALAALAGQALACIEDPVAIQKILARCWINDVELWKLVDEDPRYPHDTLPVRDEFLANCRAFYASRLKNTQWEDPPVSKTVIDDN